MHTSGGITATQLTLRMDEESIERPKRTAREQGKSVSRMVADHFELLQPTLEALLAAREKPVSSNGASSASASITLTSTQKPIYDATKY